MLGGGCLWLPLMILHQMAPRTKLNHEVEGAIHTSEVAVNGRSASPKASAGTAAAEARSPKVQTDQVDACFRWDTKACGQSQGC